MPKTKIRKNCLIFLFLILATIKYFRYLPTSLFDADQEYLALSAQSILAGKPSLLGAPTSVGGMFIGPLYNYLIASLFWLFNGDPSTVNGLSFFWATLTIPAIYFVTKRLFEKTTALFTALCALISINFIDHSNIPPLLFALPLVTITFVGIATSKLSRPKKSFLLGILTGLALNLHFTGIFFLPLLFFFGWQWIVPLSLLISPLLLFEVRHRFFITHNAINFFVQNTSVTKIPLVDRANIFFASIPSLINILIIKKLSLLLTLILIVCNTFQRKFRWPLSIAAVTFVFFLIYSGHLLSYYSIIAWPVFFMIIGKFMSKLWQTKFIIFRVLILLLLARMSITNFILWKNWSNSRSIDHKIAILNFIKAKTSNQPFYISRTMDPAVNFGFDYLIYWMGLHSTNNPADPTYTIVAPFDFERIQSDMYFGDFGLILPRLK